MPSPPGQAYKGGTCFGILFFVLISIFYLITLTIAVSELIAKKDNLSNVFNDLVLMLKVI